MSTHVTAIANWDKPRRRLVIADPLAFHGRLAKMRGLEHGEPFEVDAVRMAACRGGKLNREYFGFIVRPIALYTNQSQREIHEFLKSEMLPPEKIVLADRDGVVRFEKDIPPHTHRMTEEEFEHYMGQCRHFGATTFGIDFSPEGLFEQFGIGEG